MSVQYTEEVEGAVLGFPVSPIVSNIYIEEFENKVIKTAKTHQDYEKDMYMTLLSCKTHKEKFLQYFNSKDEAIQFTVEETRPE